MHAANDLNIRTEQVQRSSVFQVNNNTTLCIIFKLNKLCSNVDFKSDKALLSIKQTSSIFSQ